MYYCPMRSISRQTLFYTGLCSLLCMVCLGQPFVDPVSFTTRYLQSPYKDSVPGVNQTVDYNLGLFMPKELKSGHTFLLRLNSEMIHSSSMSGTYACSSNLYSVSLPVGMQLLSGNKKWKTLLMAIPKVSSDFKNNLSKDLLLGGISMVTYVKSDRLKFKLGLYYSREFWGDFFIPLVGMDWKINDHLSMYGVMPSNYRIEYKWNDRLYTGLCFKSFQRSYKLGSQQNNDFVRVKDTQLKAFVDYFVYRKLLVFADVAYGFQYSLVQYASRNQRSYSRANPLYSPFNNNFLFTVGVAYRIRLDLNARP